jgi:hypothetical protein
MPASSRARAAFPLILLACCALPAAAQDNIPSHLKHFETPYYDIYSDLDPDRVKEAALRMTRMAEEYHARTAEFSGAIRSRFPFLLFKRPEDYYAAGAPPGSAGVYTYSGGNGRLMAIAAGEDSAGAFTWHVVQHEGFHQFAHMVIRGQLPVWVNEGLAEYFGEGLFTGDGFVTGVVPRGRLARIKKSLTSGDKFRPIRAMMLMTNQDWNQRLMGDNYDQAWSMVHFLAHGEDGKYQKAMTNFMLEIGRGRPWDKAWESSFGSAEGFEKKWKDWWLGQPDNPTADLYVKACTMTYASFLGRAKMQKQTFDNFAEFAAAGKSGEVKTPDTEDWLPPSLLAAALAMKDGAARAATFELGKDPRGPQVVATLKDGTRIVATFDPKARTDRTRVEIDDLLPAIARAESLLAEQKKPEARKLLTDAIKRNPKSPALDKARKMLAGIK